jgi:hypothetical protein
MQILFFYDEPSTPSVRSKGTISNHQFHLFRHSSRSAVIFIGISNVDRSLPLRLQAEYHSAPFYQYNDGVRSTRGAGSPSGLQESGDQYIFRPADPMKNLLRYDIVLKQAEKSTASFTPPPERCSERSTGICQSHEAAAQRRFRRIILISKLGDGIYGEHAASVKIFQVFALPVTGRGHIPPGTGSRDLSAVTMST